MGRPLKIAKAQAVIVITAVNGTTEVVTTSSNLNSLGIIAGMPFVTATTVGGLTAGTTYWFLQILSDTTFTVSTTPLNANPTYTPANLTDAGPVTVATTVGLVGTGFNNPAGTANTYGIVGGNTAFYGNQVLANVAIGRSGTGTLYASDASNVVGGIGTDLGNIAADSIIQYIDSSNAVITLGYVDTATGTTTVAITDATATGNFLTTSGNAQTLYANLPVVLNANIGGLVAGTNYFVKAIPNAAAFSVSLTPGGANIGLTNQTAASNALQNTTLLVDDASANVANVAFIFATPEAGYIVRQKGKTKYLVTGSTSGLTAACYTANVANTALTPNTFNVIGTYANTDTVYMQNLNDINSQIFYDTANATANPDIYATFNTAEDANVSAGIDVPVITINKG